MSLTSNWYKDAFPDLFDEAFQTRSNEPEQASSQNAAWADIGRAIKRAESEANQMFGEPKQFSEEEKQQIKDLSRRKARLKPVDFGVMGSRRIGGNPFSIDTRQLFTGIGQAVEAPVNRMIQNKIDGDPDEIEKQKAALKEIGAELKSSKQKREQVSDEMRRSDQMILEGGSGSSDPHVNYYHENNINPAEFRGFYDTKEQKEKRGEILTDDEIAQLKEEQAAAEQKLTEARGINDPLNRLLEDRQRIQEIRKKKDAYVQNRVGQMIDEASEMRIMDAKHENNLEYLNEQMELSTGGGQGRSGTGNTAGDRKSTLNLLSGTLDVADDNIKDINKTIAEIEAGNDNYLVGDTGLADLKDKRNKMIAYKGEMSPLLVEANEQMQVNGTVGNDLKKKIYSVHNKYYDLLGWKVNANDGLEFSEDFKNNYFPTINEGFRPQNNDSGSAPPLKNNVIDLR